MASLSDLHVHSYYSDGSLSPAELIRTAKELDLVIALTDHNSVSGNAEFLSEAEKLGVTAVAGVELSTEYEGKELHVLGLFIDADKFEKVDQLVSYYKEKKRVANRRLVERLNEAGYELDFDKISKRNPSGNINRAHIAEEMMEKGYLSSVREGFDTVLSEKRGYYIPSERLSSLEAIRFLRGINALPILAHPFVELSEGELREFISEAKAAGLCGIESRHSEFSISDTVLLEAIAEEYGLLTSGGSDYHGVAKPDISLGTGHGALSVPISYYEKLLEYKLSLKAKDEGI